MKDFISRQWLDLARGQRSFDNLSDLGIAQSAGNAQRDGSLQMVRGDVAHPFPANRRCSGAHDHAAGGVLLQDVFRFEVGVRACDDLWIGQEFLRERAMLRQDSPRFESPGCDICADLAGDLFVNRYRRIVLNVEHGFLILPLRSRRFNVL